MNLLVFSGSLRHDSLNTQLAKVVIHQLDLLNLYKIQYLDIKSLALPVYDHDIEANAMPEGVFKLEEAIKNSNAIIISTPEYNGSISSPLKNTIDWVSRLKPMPLKKKPVLLLGASPGQLGAISGLAHSRRPLEVLGNYVYPQSFGLTKAHKAFSDNGQLKDEADLNRVMSMVDGFIEFAKKLS